MLPLPPNRHELGKHDSDVRLNAPKARGLPLPHSPSEPPPSATFGYQAYKDRPLVGPRGVVRSVRLELTLPTASWWCLLPLGYERAEPLARLERAAFPLREGCSAR